MNQADLDAMRARAEAAEAGPWTWSKIQESAQFGHVPAAVRHVWQAPQGRTTLFVATCDSANTDNDSNAAFISAARTDVPALLDAYEELRTLARELAVESGAAVDALLAQVRAALAQVRAALADTAAASSTEHNQGLRLEGARMLVQRCRDAGWPNTPALETELATMEREA